ncbi:hypothetical protein F4811DRAFT_533067 [Daldinia bambusicola]|nr:hypothetical protein F4811DRAFT_533067 [Daldinia bambusicola]
MTRLISLLLTLCGGHFNRAYASILAQTRLRSDAILIQLFPRITNLRQRTCDNESATIAPSLPPVRVSSGIRRSLFAFLLHSRPSCLQDV